MTDEKQPNIPHANRVENADEVGEAGHVSHVASLSLTNSVGFAEERLRVVKWIAVIVGSVAVICAMVTAGYVLVSRNTSAEQVSRQLTEVRTQLDDAKAQLAKVAAQDTGITVCVDRLSRNVSASSQAATSSLLHLVIQLARQQTYDIGEAEAADKAYSEAISLRDHWVEAGRVLPCPLDS